MTPSEHVGMRVRMYRTQKQLSLKEFARRINKAPSTVSKYESGAIAIDVNSVFEMATALEVDVSQLIDYQMPIRPPVSVTTGNFFQRANIYYVYALFSPRKTPYICIMELIRTNASDSFGKLVFHFDVESIHNYTNSAYLYNGEFKCCDYGTIFYLNNSYSPSDVGMIYARTPFSAGNTAQGIFTFLPSKFPNPCSTKVLFSITPIGQDENLLRELSISDKNTIAMLKKDNLLMIN